jgi:hypothetical protein
MKFGAPGIALFFPPLEQFAFNDSYDFLESPDLPSGRIRLDPKAEN